MYEIERYTTVNVTGTVILLDYLTNENTIEKVVVASCVRYTEGKYFFAENERLFYPTDRNEADLQ